MPSHCSDDCRVEVEKIVYVHETEKERVKRLAKEQQQKGERSRRAKEARERKKKARVEELTTEIKRLGQELGTEGKWDSIPEVTKLRALLCRWMSARVKGRSVSLDSSPEIRKLYDDTREAVGDKS